MIYLCKRLKDLCHLRFCKHLKFKALFCMLGAWCESHSKRVAYWCNTNMPFLQISQSEWLIFVGVKGVKN